MNKLLKSNRPIIITFILFVIFSAVSVVLYLNFDNPNQYSYTTKSIEIDTVSYIEISLMNTEIEIKTHESDKIFLDYTVDEEPDIVHGDNKLTITQNESIKIPVFLFNKPENRMVLHLPARFYHSIKTVNSSGNITVSDVTAGSVYCSTKNGDIKVVDTDSEVVIVTSGGNVDFKPAVLYNVRASTLSGNVDITLPENADFNVVFKSQFGTISTFFDDKPAQSPYSVSIGESNITLDLQTKTGNVLLKEGKDNALSHNPSIQ